MRVKELWEYPVKSLAGYQLDSATLMPRGLAHDRRWMLIDEAGVFISQRKRPALSRIQARVEGDALVLTDLDGDGGSLHIPAAQAEQGPAVTVQVWDDRVEARLVTTAPAAALEAFMGFPCRLVYMASDSHRPVDERYAKPGEEVSFADGFPYLIANSASLDAFAALYGEAVSMQRFRPNVVVEGAAAFAEDHWARVGTATAVFRTPKPCARCVMITIDPETGKKQPRVWAELASLRAQGNKVLFGVNACWEGQGSATIQVGEDLWAD